MIKKYIQEQNLTYKYSCTDLFINYLNFFCICNECLPFGIIKINFY